MHYPNAIAGFKSGPSSLYLSVLVGRSGTSNPAGNPVTIADPPINLPVIRAQATMNVPMTLSYV